MINRRDFLQFSGAALGTLALRNSLFAAAGQFPLGVQLYTVRDQAEKDLGAVLAHISMIGYTEVETYWNVYTHPAKELRSMIIANGLSVPSGHFDYDGLESKLDYAKELGVHYVVCPMLPKICGRRPTGSKRRPTNSTSGASRCTPWGCSSASTTTITSSRNLATPRVSIF